MRCSINVSLNLLRWVVKTSIATLKSLSTGTLANITVFHFKLFFLFFNGHLDWDANMFDKKTVEISG